MNILRAIAVAFLLLAVPASPVVAFSMPCRCVEPAEAVETCCQLPADLAATEPPSDCCSRTDQITQFERMILGCCCITAPQMGPITPETAARPEVKQPSVVFTTFQAIDLRLFSTAPRDRERPSDHVTLSGPSLLALHCTWLK